MQLRPYQIQAKEAIQEQWASGVKNSAGPTHWHRKDNSFFQVG